MLALIQDRPTRARWAGVRRSGRRKPQDPARAADLRCYFTSITIALFARLDGETEAKTVELEVNLKARASAAVSKLINIVGEIPGGAKKDEIVMVGAHFDSWHSGTGATDNGAGSAVMMEVVRILKALDLKMDRTVRIALWSGEEEGLLGSKAYVKEHFGDPKTMKLTAAHAKLSGYFNLDNGSGKIRGVYLQGNDAMRPLFEDWLEPFRDLGVSTITIRNTGGTDHLSFDAVGLPGFQFIQDPLDYCDGDASFEHGHLRSRRAGRLDAGRGSDRVGGVRCGDAGGYAAAQAVARRRFPRVGGRRWAGPLMRHNA